MGFRRTSCEANFHNKDNTFTLSSYLSCLSEIDTPLPFDYAGFKNIPGGVQVGL